jgi:glutathione S-transferase
MKVYEYKGFPNPTRVRIALAEKGLLDKVQFAHVDVPGGEHKKPAFLAKNPSGAAPLLELHSCGNSKLEGHSYCRPGPAERRAILGAGSS